jgi:hypothetical protein
MATEGLIGVLVDGESPFRRVMLAKVLPVGDNFVVEMTQGLMVLVKLEYLNFEAEKQARN